jgi:Ca2+-binding RTX toxin-like protein
MRALVTAAAVGAALFASAVAQAGTVTLANGVMTFEAASGEANRIFVVRDDGGMRLIDTAQAVTAAAGCTQVNAGEAFCASDDLTLLEIDVVGGDEEDYVDLRPAGAFLASRLDGGDGDDTLIGGRAFTGNRFEGGPGGDTFGGDGILDYSARTNPVTVTIGDGLANDGEAGEGDLVPNAIDQVFGGHGADTLIALNVPDVGATYLVGRGGNDHVSALRRGWPAIVEGNGGDDVLRSEGSDAASFGGGGDDVLLGAQDGQALWGGKGADVLRGQAGRDLLHGGAGADLLSGGSAKDTVFGNDGNDKIQARDGKRDYLDGGSGKDKARSDAFDHLARMEGSF